MQLLSGALVILDPVAEFLEMGALTCLESRLSIIHTVLLHRPSVVWAEVEKVPEFGVPTAGLKDVSILDVRVSQHRCDHILQSLKVLFDLIGPEPVVDCIAIFLLLRRSDEAVKKHDVQGYLLLAINLFQASLYSSDGIETHCSATINIHAAVDFLRYEESWKTS